MEYRLEDGEKFRDILGGLIETGRTRGKRADLQRTGLPESGIASEGQQPTEAGATAAEHPSREIDHYEAYWFQGLKWRQGL